MRMIFLYEKKYGAFQNAYDHSLPILTVFGSRRYGDRSVIECRVGVLTPEQRAELESAGIGVDDPMDEVPDALKSRINTMLCDPFFTTRHVSTQTEYDLRKSGSIMFVCDRENKISIFLKIGDEYREHYVHTYTRDWKKEIADLAYSEPIQKVVLFRDYWCRIPPYAPSLVAEEYPTLRKVPKTYPEPIREPSSEPAPIIAPDLLPFAEGTEMRIEMVDEVRTTHFWDGAVYINKEQLKRWGAKFHVQDKYWYFEKVPTAERQRAIKVMHIILRPKFT